MLQGLDDAQFHSQLFNFSIEKASFVKGAGASKGCLTCLVQYLAYAKLQETCSYKEIIGVYFSSLLGHNSLRRWLSQMYISLPPEWPHARSPFQFLDANAQDSQNSIATIKIYLNV